MNITVLLEGLRETWKKICRQVEQTNAHARLSKILSKEPLVSVTSKRTHKRTSSSALSHNTAKCCKRDRRLFQKLCIIPKTRLALRYITRNTQSNLGKSDTIWRRL